MLVEARDIEGGVRILTLNRPPANAISREFNEALYEQCREAREQTPVRALIVTGAGRFFSGGLDIKEAAAGRSRVGVLGSGERDGVFALWTMPKPTVAMINGHAIAGGLIIALACDFKLCARGSHKLGLNEVAIGLALPIAAVEIVRLALDCRQLRYAMLEAELHGPERAHELGYVDELLEADQLEARALAMARKLAGNGQLAYAEVKRLLQRQAVERVQNATPEELKKTGEVARSVESQALLAAQAQALSHR